MNDQRNMKIINQFLRNVRTIDIVETTARNKLHRNKHKSVCAGMSEKCNADDDLTIYR